MLRVFALFSLVVVSGVPVIAQLGRLADCKSIHSFGKELAERARRDPNAGFRVGRLLTPDHPPISPAELREIRKALLVAHATPEDLASDAAEHLRYALQGHGYFKAEVSHQAAVRDGLVDVTLTAQPHQQFRFTSLNIIGATRLGSGSLGTEPLRRLFSLKPGDLFDVRKIHEGLEKLRRVYGEFGFLDMTALPTPDLNDAERTIALKLDIEEGKQFYIREIRVFGGTERQQKLITERFYQHRGDIYNARLVEQFVNLHRRDLGIELPRDIDMNIDQAAGSVAIRFNLLRCPK